MRKFIDKWIFPKEDRRLLVVTTFVSFVVIFLTTLTFYLSNSIMNNQIKRDNLSRTLDAFISKNDIVNQFFIRGAGVETLLLQEWAYYFIVLRDGRVNSSVADQVKTLQARDSLLDTFPNLLEVKNQERVSLGKKINLYQLLQNSLFFVSVIFQLLNTINLFSLTKRTLPLSRVECSYRRKWRGKNKYQGHLRK